MHCSRAKGLVLMEVSVDLVRRFEAVFEISNIVSRKRRS